MAQLPLVFERNQGQAPGDVRYLSRGSGYGLQLSSRGGALRLHTSRSAHRAATLTWRFAGAGRTPIVSGERRLPGESHYLRGRSASAWLTHLPQYGQVRYRGVYPGIDLLYYGRDRQLEYDFVVAPGADPGEIRIAYRGADRARISGDGNLIFTTSAGEVVQQRPRIYQEEGGRQVAVSGAFRLAAAGSAHEVRFRVGDYDRNRPLVIDPVLHYSTRLGGSSGDAANGIAVDAEGNAYVVGETDSTDFPTTSGVFQHNPQGGSSSNEVDAFVTKLSADGSQILYSTYLGGTDDDVATGVAVDANGRAYVAGYTASGDFPTTSGAFRTTKAGGDHDGFVVKLKADGSGLGYATFLGGFLDDQVNAIALDSQNRAWVTGQTSSGNFPVTANAPQAASGGLGFSDAFATELKDDGSDVLFSTYLGGSDDDFGTGIAVDRDDAAYVAGTTSSGDFPVTQNALKTVHNSSNSDAFLVKFQASGSVAYSTYLGGNNGDEDQVTVAVDRRRTAYVLGRTTSDNLPVLNAYQKRLSGAADLFVSHVDSTGGHLLYSTYLGGTKAEKAGGIGVDLGGNVYLVGSSNSDDFPVLHGVSSRSQQQDAVVASLDPTGKVLLYATYLGGATTDAGRALAVDPLGAVYAAGRTDSATFPTTIGAFSRTEGGAWIACVLADAPAAPGNLVARVANRSEVDLTWKDNSTNEAVFEVSTSVNGSDFQVVALVPANTTSYAVTNLQTGQAYTFRVRSLNSGGGSAYVSVDATPTAAGKLAVSPKSLNFGSITHGGQPRVKSFRIKNAGQGTLNVVITAPTVDVFQAQPTGAQAVAPNSSITVQVTFHPLTAGTFNDTIQITSDARTNATAKVKLKGIGK